MKADLYNWQEESTFREQLITHCKPYSPFSYATGGGGGGPPSIQNPLQSGRAQSVF